MAALSDLAKRGTVNNVLIFVADSLRFDSLPSRIAQRGVTARTVAASTYTATSIPSMASGLYPATHRVWSFDDVLPETPELLAGEHCGTDLRNVWDHVESPAEKPPNRILRVTEERTLEGLGEPFTLLVHDKGAHAPYDYTNVRWDTSPEFFRHFAGRDQELRNLYQRGATTAAERFEGLVDMLHDRELYDDTLVVFTSDHGELLGEPSRGGVYAHGAPVCPELVSVPTVFMGAGLPEGEVYDELLSGVDLAPTAIAARGETVPDDVEGVDVWTKSPSADRVVRSEFWAKGGRVSYGASSAWNRDGGVVRHHGRASERVAFAIHRKLVKGAQAPANRSRSPYQMWRLLRTFGDRELVYGSVDPQSLRPALVEEFRPNDSTSDVAAASKEQLEALGYLE
ncbi:sulfatase-like hydrolase/transferase [Halomarina salina]|uniref:Sulfatase-like hydrolase/transferase n=1 Tax=Halomarina salina TaxID=1872699 RepID=A0ABD5RKN6_9EURY|nr:sulfatase-like hydrolase/transferase [Halomarina salina]